MEGTIAMLKTSPVRAGAQVDESTVYFHRLFWIFPPCIEAFRHCKPLVSIDGTHLYGKYGGTLLLAIAQDGNSNILSVVFALVEGENADFKGQDTMWLLVNVAYAKTEAEFDYWFDIMRTDNPAMCDWTNRMEYERWTQHKDGGRRYGHMTTSISECVNSVLKGTRNLPVKSLTAEAQLGSGHWFFQALVKAIERNLRDSRCFTVTLFDRHQSEYTVAETTPTCNFSVGTYRVSLRNRTCDCGHFLALHYPCCHAIACCAQSRLDWATHVDEVYSMSEVFKVYQMGFALCIPEGLWPPYDGPTVILNPNMRRDREGQSQSTRIRNNMDEGDSSRPKRCGLCRKPGHTRRSSPQRGSTVGS
ncbi:uncharacterized protein LOC130970222 [Arachis stenosperma]|uniref:uncharacterized protein LOC130970222 n=1 Tax=Arachis stenosperma TaxID=217475 RepID=UPI0025ABC30C|nr:uncharacterized protein LOC130970222 [Arachis stenosperma]